MADDVRNDGKRTLHSSWSACESPHHSGHRGVRHRCYCLRW